MSSPGLTQTSKDSTLIPNSQLRLALTKVDAGKACAVQLVLQVERSRLLEDRIEIKDSTISSYKRMDVANRSIIASQNTEVTNLLTQREILERGLKAMEKQARRAKTKTLLTTITGVAGMAALGVLLIIK